MRGKGHSCSDETITGYIEDFFTAKAFPQAFEWSRQPPQWRQAMKLLAMTWELGKLQLTRTAFEKN